MANVFVPLNRFQSVVANLTGEQDQIYVTPTGVSSIVLSCQVTNNSFNTQPVTILVTSNRELPVPNFEGIFSTGSFTSASALLTANRQFIRKEVAAYANYLNNLSETPFTFTSSRFEGYALTLTDAIAYDIKNNTTIRTNKEAKSFFTKNGVNIIQNVYPEEYSASIYALDYVNTIAQQVIQNQSVTGSTSVDRLYQTAITQSFNSNYVTTGSLLSGSSFLISELVNVVKTTVQSPNVVAQEPVQLVTNVLIPSADSLSPVVAGKLVLEDGYGFIVSGSPELSVILSLLESANE
jgi:hypothetical protein